MQTTNKQIRIAAIGDLLLTAKPGSDEPQRGLEALSAEIGDIFASADIVLANLECTLKAQELIATEPRVFTTNKQLESLATAGINLVTMANNHAFDSFDAGFDKTIDTLDKTGIRAFGAGKNSQQACAPAIFTINGISIAFVAAVDRSTGMHSFAAENKSGVPALESATICATIKELKTQYDHVIFTPHWGEERFRFPSPQQIDQAHAFIDAGASLVLGHHPHVIQGTEQYGAGFIAYSLGNFLTNNVYWENGDVLTWNKFERSSEIILIDLKADEIVEIQQIPIYDNGTHINIEKSGHGKHYLKKADLYISKGITAAKYRRESYLAKSLLPITKQLRWDKLRRIKPGHFTKALKLLLQQK